MSVPVSVPVPGNLPVPVLIQDGELVVVPELPQIHSGLKKAIQSSDLVLFWLFISDGNSEISANVLSNFSYLILRHKKKRQQCRI